MFEHYFNDVFPSPISASFKRSILCKCEFCQLQPAGVDRLALFKNTSTQLRGRATVSLLKFLQADTRVLPKQEVLQRLQDTFLYSFLLFHLLGFSLQAINTGDLLCHMLSYCRLPVWGLPPFLKRDIHINESSYMFLSCWILRLNYLLSPPSYSLPSVIFLDLKMQKLLSMHSSHPIWIIAMSFLLIDHQIP